MASCPNTLFYVLFCNGSLSPVTRPGRPAIKHQAPQARPPVTLRYSSLCSRRSLVPPLPDRYGHGMALVDLFSASRPIIHIHIHRHIGIYLLIGTCPLLFCHRARTRVDDEIFQENRRAERVSEQVGFVDSGRRGMGWWGSIM